MEIDKHKKIKTNRCVKHPTCSCKTALTTSATANTDIYFPWKDQIWMQAMEQDFNLDREETTDKEAVNRVLEPVLRMIRAGLFDAQDSAQ